ncbi:MAG: DUF3108 domain-containing protein [Muribaculaceae bacterium]|nr:DUF3108 domain-containing protein [Muribaculaceae bacterium]
MKRNIYILMLVLLPLSVVAATFADETLRYRVEYKWGLVEKTAGYVSIQLTGKPDRYHSRLTAATAKWADKFYKVRDTLSCEVMKSGYRPVFYEKNSHEGGDDKHDYVKYSYRGNTVTGDCTRRKWTNGKLERDEKRVLEAEGVTVDMLSAFYYMRSLPYTTWKVGQKHVVNIFSGKRKELLTIIYRGVEKVTYDHRTYDCYHISFTFTSDGKKKTSDDMEAWIDTSGSHIPVRLEGKLPIGKVRCFLEKSE